MQNENLNLYIIPSKREGGIRNDSGMEAFWRISVIWFFTWAPGVCNMYKIGP